MVNFTVKKIKKVMKPISITVRSWKCTGLGSKVGNAAPVTLTIFRCVFKCKTVVIASTNDKHNEKKRKNITIFGDPYVKQKFDVF